MTNEDKFRETFREVAFIEKRVKIDQMTSDWFDSPYREKGKNG